MQIGNRTIGPTEPTYVVAEIGGNAHHDYLQARALIASAAGAGADAIKVQVFTPDAMTLDVDQPSHRLEWHGKPYTLHALYAETSMPLEWHADLMAYANACGLDYFGSVFDQAGIDLGERLGFPAYKVASFELTHTPLIRAIAKTGKPILLSTGMATLDEIYQTETGLCPRVFLKCTTSYPAPVSDTNLATISQRFLFASNKYPFPNPFYPYVFGLSDHTRSNAVVSAAVALGARVVERHLTLRRSDGGPDAPFSDEPHEFAEMVRTIRDTEAALGTVHYGPTESEMGMLRYRRSIWVARDVAAGEVLSADNIAVLRPTGGLEPSEWERVLGRKAARALARGEPLRREMLEG